MTYNMKTFGKKTVAAAAVALLAVTIALICGTTAYARYRGSRVRANAPVVEYGFTTDGVHITSPDPDGEGNYPPPSGWTTSASDSRTLDFLLANRTNGTDIAAYDQNVTLSVFISSGMTGSDITSVALTTPYGDHTASGSALAEGTALFAEFGPGRIYEFTGADGEPLEWFLPANTATGIGMTLTVNGSATYPARIILVATGSPVKE